VTPGDAVLAVFLLGGLALVAWGAMWTVFAAERSRRDEIDATWRRVAETTGLAFVPGPRSHVEGLYDGLQITIAVVGGATRGGQARTYTEVEAHLPFPLDLGLSVRQFGLHDRAFHPAPDLTLGDPDFDRYFHVSGDEPGRVRHLVGPDLQRHVRQQFGGTDVFISDRSVMVRRLGVVKDERWLRWAVEATSRAGQLLEERRETCPIASPLVAHRRRWRAFGRAHGLELRNTPLCLSGEIEGAEVSVYAARTDRLTYALEIALCFARPLGLGLSVRPLGLTDRIAVFFGGEDMRFDEPDFDAAFRIQTHDPEATAELLSPGVRQDLLALRQQVGPAAVDDYAIRLRVTGLPRDPGVVPQLVQRLLSVAETMVEETDGRRGPYR